MTGRMLALLVGSVFALTVILAVVLSSVQSAQGNEPVNAPAGAESYELPDGHGGVIGGWTWCSHGTRVWQSYAWEDSTNGSRVLALTSQKGGGGCG